GWGRPGRHDDRRFLGRSRGSGADGQHGAAVVSVVSRDELDGAEQQSGDAVHDRGRQSEGHRHEGGRGADRREVTGGYTTSKRPAAPIPPPMHIVTTTVFARRRLPSMSACPTRRAPDIPYGWPTAIAPPLTLSRSSGMPRRS